MALLGLICLSVNMIDAAPSAMDFAKMFGLVYNTKYTGAFIEDNKQLSLSYFWNVTDSLTRNIKFYKPPASVADEVLHDTIDDQWDYNETQQENF